MAKQLKAAHDGDVRVRQWCLEQYQCIPAPTRKLKLPPIQELKDIGEAHSVILKEVARGRCSVAEGRGLMDMLEQKGKLIETQDLEERIRQLERLEKERPA
jgi:hypothetical protein